MIIFYFYTMQRKIITTSDGSSSVFVPGLNEHYHSVHGAETESKHIFINAAFRSSTRDPVHILELGMGTGLNVILTFLAARETERTVSYHAVEKYPLDQEEVSQLTFGILNSSESRNTFMEIHGSPWQQEISISKDFSLYKDRSDFRSFEPDGRYDVIYFDAFAPDVQPGLWTTDMFMKLFKCTSAGGILTTYSARGTVKRSMIATGYQVEKLPGPPGKREFLRARC